MVLINVNGKETYIDGFLKQKLDNVKYLISKNWDCVVLVDGLERSGKSTLALLMGSYLDKDFGLKNICVDSKDAVNKIENLPDKSVLLIDEGSLIFSSKDSMKAEQKKLMKIINVCGQKNMMLLIVLPCFFELQKYLATTRAGFLVHIYTDEKMTRGRFAYWSGRKLKILYLHGKKNFNSYRYPEANFVGKFTKFEPEWYNDYLKLKRVTLMSALKEDTSPKRPKVLLQRDLLLRLIYTKRWMSQKEMALMFQKNDAGMDASNISLICNKYEGKN